MMPRRLIHRLAINYPDFLTQECLRDLRSAFSGHRSGAEHRGIAFELSWHEWLQVWIASGHLHERGRKRGQYCMARIGDDGPYAVGNVRIILHSQNSIEGNTGKRLSAETRAKISASVKLARFGNGLAYRGEVRR